MSGMNGVGAAGGVQPSGYLQGGESIVAMTPESLVALCGLQLRQFDQQMMGLMNEKKDNMELQKALTSLGGLLGGEPIGPADWAKRDQIEAQLQEIERLCNGDPAKYASIKADVENIRSQLRNGVDAQTYKANCDAFGTSYREFDKKLAEHGLTRETAIDANGNLTEAARQHQDLVIAKNAQDQAYSKLGPGTTKESLGSINKTVNDMGNSLNGRNDEILMQLQSIVSQRSTSIQMTSNLTNALLEASKAIANNIGK